MARLSVAVQQDDCAALAAKVIMDASAVNLGVAFGKCAGRGATGTRHTPVSEILALNDHQLLVLERDGIFGGAGYKNVNLADLSSATNLRHMPGVFYDLENDVAGQIDLPSGASLPAGITPIARQDFISLLDPGDLASFGLNNNSSRDGNTLYEKWEAMALVSWDPLDPGNSDFLLLVGNDNDFSAGTVYHNGEAVGHNDLAIDNMLFAYHVTLPAAALQAVPEGSTWTGVLGLALAIFYIRRRRC